MALFQTENWTQNIKSLLVRDIRRLCGLLATFFIFPKSMTDENYFIIPFGWYLLCIYATKLLAWSNWIICIHLDEKISIQIGNALCIVLSRNIIYVSMWQCTLENSFKTYFFHCFIIIIIIINNYYLNVCDVRLRWTKKCEDSCIFYSQTFGIPSLLVFSSIF